MQAVVLVGVAVISASAVAVASVVLGGGGGTASKEEYESTVVKARNQVEFALQNISGRQSLEGLVARLQQASVTADDAANDLANAAVANGFRDENDKLVGALVALSSELSGTAATIADPEFTQTLPHLTSLSFKQWAAVNRILGRLRDQGIDVKSLARH